MSVLAAYGVGMIAGGLYLWGSKDATPDHPLDAAGHELTQGCVAGAMLLATGVLAFALAQGWLP